MIFAYFMMQWWINTPFRTLKSGNTIVMVRFRKQKLWSLWFCFITLAIAAWSISIWSMSPLPGSGFLQPLCGTGKGSGSTTFLLLLKVGRYNNTIFSSVLKADKPRYIPFPTVFNQVNWGKCCNSLFRLMAIHFSNRAGKRRTKSKWNRHKYLI